MGELLNSGLLSIASGNVFVGAGRWAGAVVFVNRASSRTNEQIELLEALLDQQKRQTALLRRLCEANEPEEKAVPKDAVAQQQDEEDFIRPVAER